MLYYRVHWISLLNAQHQNCFIENLQVHAERERELPASTVHWKLLVQLIIFWQKDPLLYIKEGLLMNSFATQ
jgi:hypothetical protein